MYYLVSVITILLCLSTLANSCRSYSREHQLGSIIPMLILTGTIIVLRATQEMSMLENIISIISIIMASIAVLTVIIQVITLTLLHMHLVSEIIRLCKKGLESVARFQTLFAF